MNGAFTFAFDDGYTSWSSAGKILKEAGFRGMFNVCLRNAVEERKPNRGRMFPIADIITWDEVRALQHAGHEIGAHGTRHISLDTATWDELIMEIEAPKRIFNSRGVHSTSYACQFNTSCSEAEKIGLASYQSFRAGVHENPWPPASRVFHAMGWPDAVRAIRPDVWIVSVWHDPDLDELRKKIDQVKEAGCKVVTVAEAYESRG